MSVPAPHLDRGIVLQMMGDWGQANLHRVCCWLSQEIVDRTADGTKIAIWNGRGMGDAPRRVGSREVDLGLTVPVAFAPAALDGSAMYRGEKFPNLRALGTIPQDDRLLLALDGSLGIRTFDDLRANRGRLKLCTSMDDGVNTIGYAVHRLLEAANVPVPSILEAGGAVFEDERPEQSLGRMLRGEANAVFSEAVMAPWWRQLAESRPIRFVSVEDGVLSRLEKSFHWPRGSLAAGYLPGMEEKTVTLDFSDFLLICRDDLPEDVAYLIAWCLGETHAALERWYRHLPRERSGITWPLDPAAIAKTSIALHPGACRYYVEKGVLS